MNNGENGPDSTEEQLLVLFAKTDYCCKQTINFAV